MPLEKSAGAIIFRQPRSRTPKENKFPTGQASSLWGKKKEIKYLLLHYPSGSNPKKDYWDFPKGHIEKGEEEIDAAKREIKEETGLDDIEIIEGFKEHIKYFFRFKGQAIFKIVTFYLAKTQTEDVKISFEHIGYQWLAYEKAFNQLTFDNAKEILRKARQFLEK